MWSIKNGSEVVSPRPGTVPNTPAPIALGYRSSITQEKFPTIMSIELHKDASILYKNAKTVDAAIQKSFSITQNSTAKIEQPTSDFSTASLLSGYKTIISFVDQASKELAHGIIFYIIRGNDVFTLSFYTADTEYYKNLSSFIAMALSFRGL